MKKISMTIIALLVSATALADTTSLKCDGNKIAESKLISGSDSSLGNYESAEIGYMQEFFKLASAIGEIRVVTATSENEGTDLTLVVQGRSGGESSTNCALTYYKGYNLIGFKPGEATSYKLLSSSVTKITSNIVALDLVIKPRNLSKITKRLIIELIKNPSQYEFKIMN